MGRIGMDSGMMGGMGSGMMGMMPGGPAGALAGGADSPSQGVWIGEITDGTSNTAFLAVAAEAVEWTKPGELAAAYDHPPALEVSDPRGLVVGLVDGSVRFLPPGPRRDQFLWFLITRSGGEVLDWNNYFPRELPEALKPVPPPPSAPRHREPTPVVPPTPAATPPSPAAAPPPAEPSLEDRMRRMEEKLDRLLRKLDDAPAP